MLDEVHLEERRANASEDGQGGEAMKIESLKELIELCRAGQCAVTLEACQSGIVAKVVANRGEVSKQTSVWLDNNDKEMVEKLEAAIRRVQ